MKIELTTQELVDFIQLIENRDNTSYDYGITDYDDVLNEMREENECTCGENEACSNCIISPKGAKRLSKLEKEIEDYINSRTGTLFQQLVDNKLKIEGGYYTDCEIDKKKLKDVLIKRKIEFKKDGITQIKLGDELINVVELSIDGLEFVAISTPKALIGKTLRDINIFKDIEDNDWFIGDNFLDKKIEKPFIIWQKENYKNEDGEVLLSQTAKEYMKIANNKLFTLISIEDNFILYYIIKKFYGEDFSNYSWGDLDEYLEKIEDLIKIKFSEFTDDDYIVKNWGFYLDKYGNVRVFLRGARASTSADAALFALNLPWSDTAWDRRVGFRCSL